jgi:hypothetical protein
MHCNGILHPPLLFLKRAITSANTCVCSGGGRKLQEQAPHLFSGPAGEVEQEGYKQFVAVNAQADGTYNAAGLGDTEQGKPLTRRVQQFELQTQILRTCVAMLPSTVALCIVKVSAKHCCATCLHLQPLTQHHLRTLLTGGRQLQEQTVFSGPAGVAEQEGLNQAVAAYGQFQGLAGATGIGGLDIADEDGEQW